MKIKGFLKSNKGGSGISVLMVILLGGIIVFVIMPLFSYIMEQYIVYNKVQKLKTSIDMTNIAAYNALDKGMLSKEAVAFNSSKALAIYQELLAKNLQLNSDLTPKPDSIAEGTVTIVSLEEYTNGFPMVCPNGTGLKRPTIHSVISVPVRPTLYRQVILSMLHLQYVDLVIHVDSDIPINN
jgi:hypothetical protein